MLVTCSAPQRFLIDQLAEAIEKGRILGRDRHLRQISFKSKRGEFLGGVREQIDADADRFDFGSGFKYPAGNSGSVQRKPKCQSADAGADDDDVVHVPFRHLWLCDFPDQTRLAGLLSINRSVGGLLDETHPHPRGLADHLTRQPRGAGPRLEALVVVGGAGTLEIAMRAPAVLVFGTRKLPAAARLRAAGEAARIIRTLAVA